MATSNPTIYATDEYLDLAVKKFDRLLAPLTTFTYMPLQGTQIAKSTVSVGLVQNQLSASIFTGTYEVSSTTDEVDQVAVNLQHAHKAFFWPQLGADINPLAVIESTLHTNAQGLGNFVFQLACAPIVSGSVSASIFTSANGFRNAISGSTNTNFDLSAVKTVAKTLASQSALVSECNLIIPQDYGVNVIPTSNAFGTYVGSAFTDGVISGYMGMNYFPVTYPVDASGTVKGFGAHQTAAVCITGIPPCPGMDQYLRYEIIELPTLKGCKVAYREWVQLGTGAHYGDFELLIGSAAANTDGAVIIY